MNPYRQGDTFDPSTVAWVTDPEHVPAMLRAIADSAEVVIDLETSGLDEHATGDNPDWPESARIVMAALTLPTEADPTNERPPTYVVPLSHPDSPLRGRWRAVVGQIVDAIADAGRPITNQNLKFDLRWLYAFTERSLVHLFAWDTQIGSHLLDENASTRLKERAPDTFGVERWDDHPLNTPAAAERVPLYELGLYAARDTYWTWRLAVLQRTLMGVGREGAGAEDPETPDEVEDRRLGALAVWCAMPTSATLTAVEQRGFALDVDWVRDRIKESEEVALTTRDDLASLYVMERPPEHASFAPTSHWFREWTECAVAAGDLRVGALTPNGAPQWSKGVLTRQARTGSEVAAMLLQHRDAVKRLEFLRSWLECVTPEGTIHATYHAGRVVTGRLSSSGPNMQQVTKTLRPAFIPRPGYLIADLDYSQIELRVAAFISRSEPMMQAYQDGLDLHRLIAAQTTGKPAWEVTGDERQRGKAANFGYLYGMSAEGFREYAETAYGVILTPEEAEESRAAFFGQWEGIAAWHVKAEQRARATGQVVSPIGRVRRLPDIWADNPRAASHAARNAINSPVQGFASDIMQIASASIEGSLPGYEPVPDVRIVATVHDSIVAEVPEDDWKRATGRMMRRMLDVGPVLRRMGCDLDVPLGVEAVVGTRWGLGDVGTIQ